MSASLTSQGAIDEHLSDLAPYESLREHIHANPELSGQEKATAHAIAECLRSLGVFSVYENIGGPGIAAVFNNGSGITLMLRSDMDALPIREQAKVPFASKVNQPDRDGNIQPVMHACGHDIHIACLLASANTLIKMRTKWAGTLILVFQPAEEQGTGAQAMIDDGLYLHIPVPDLVLFQHVDTRKAGQVGIRAGPMLTAADSFKITFYGQGGHGGLPELTIDPIVMAASAILRLQTIVSREISASDEMAVVTVGTIHAGQAENVIPDQAEVGMNVRTINQETRTKVLDAIYRIVRAESIASGAKKEPSIVHTINFPPTINDHDIVEKLKPAFREAFKDNFNPNLPRLNASEDFSILATHVGKPYAVWFIGSTDPDLYDRAEKEGTLKEIPGNHTPSFSPVTQPTLKVGVRALCTAALALFNQGEGANGF